MSQPTVTVVGAGFTGLSQALSLADQGFSVRLFEASAHWGGLIGTQYTDFGLVETAANGLLNSADVEWLFNKVGLELQKTNALSRRRYIFKSKLTRNPLSLSVTVKSIFRFLLQKEKLKPQPQETVAQWCSRHLGEEVLNDLLQPALNGIYAGDVTKMSASLILSPLFSPKSDPKPKVKGTVSAQGGMQSLTNAILGSLLKHNVDLRLQEPFDFAKHGCPGPLVVCVRADRVPNILQQLNKEFHFPVPEMLPLVTVTQFYKKSDQPFSGFGCLFPYSESFNSLGVLCNPCIFSGRTAEHSETWILGGALFRQVVNWSDEQLLAAISEDRKRITDAPSAPLHSVITRWPVALPHYTVEWEKALGEIVLPERVYLNGNFMGGLGLTKILKRSRQISAELKTQA